MCPSVRVNTCGPDAIALHHIPAVKCVNCSSNIILGVGLVVDVKLQFPGLQSHLTLILSVYSVGIFETQGKCRQSLH
jgi:hypothetical protein